jgi:ABC-type dipeptide/oligopeptide/nickel transport system permease subunit
VKPARRPLPRTALIWLLLLGAAALAAPWLPLPAPSAMDDGLRLSAPAWTAAPVLGTDPLGRDLLARSLAGARVSLVVGLLGAAVALAIGVPYGAAAGLLGGRADRWMMRAADALESVPMVVVILFLLALAQEYRAALAAAGAT